jgi:pilus assembly protein CpaB
MRMDRRFWIVTMASLLWGLLVAGFFYRVAAGSGRRSRAGPQKAMVVAARELPFGSNLTRESVKLRNVPENLFPAGGFSRIEDVLDRPVISAIQPDEPVVEARIAARGSGLGLAPLIPPGMRAMAVRVNDVVGVAGFLLPGMRVDVLVTGRPPGRSDAFTRTVLQNITVLSAGQTIETDGKSQSINTPVVTLLVSPSEAEVLTLANSEGHIQLVLRNSSDQRVAGTRGRQTLELYGAPPVVEAAAGPAPKPRRAAQAAAGKPAAVAVPVPPPPAADQVLVIRGNVKTLEALPKSGGSK